MEQELEDSCLKKTLANDTVAAVNEKVAASPTVMRYNHHGGNSDSSKVKRKTAYSDDDDDEFLDPVPPPPPGERLAPVGGNAEEDNDADCGGGRSGRFALAKRPLVSASSKEDSFESFVDSRLGEPTVAAALSSASAASSAGAAMGVSAGMDAINREEGVKLKRKIVEMEEEQEELNNSLMEMTSHFAKVQLRLQQVVSAPPEKREDLLKELESFAFRGIPTAATKAPPVGSNGGGGGGGGGLTDQEDLFTEDDEDEVDDQQDEEEDLSLTSTRDVAIAAQRKKHLELISQLKRQLEELESYAYASGDAESLPSNVLLGRQRIVMDRLRSRLNLDTEHLVRLTEDELVAEVDQAIAGQIVNPLRMKSRLVGQLKTQIQDLEMFIQFLQSETSTMIPAACGGCGCSKHNSPEHSNKNGKSGASAPNSPNRSKNGCKHQGTRFRQRTKSEQAELRRRTETVLQKALAVLQLATISHLGCGGGIARGGGDAAGAGSGTFYKNTLKQTSKANHFGDLRARLELSIDHLLEACSQTEVLGSEDAATTDDDDDEGGGGSGGRHEDRPEYLMSSPRVTNVARRQLAVAIRDLMQHGLLQTGGRASLVPFMGCMSSRSSRAGPASPGSSSSSSSSRQHAWDVVMAYYRLKRGHEFNSAPQRKLSQSFGLDLAPDSSSSLSSSSVSPSAGAGNNRASLLAVIGQIVASHGQYKRSPDAHFKAFVCAGLNKRKLIPWLKLILRNQTIVESHYASWSYVAKTGFDDAFRAIERLSMYVFDLPVDMAVRQFQEMTEAF